MKKALQNFNRESPRTRHWEERQQERLEHIRLKRQLKSKKEADEDETEHGDSRVLQGHER